MTMTAGTPNLIGSRVARKEDPRILTGRTQYLDDVVVPGLIEGAVLRSPHAHAKIVSIDVSKALELPGVFSVVVGSDITAYAETQPVIWHVLPNHKLPEHYAMATDTVRWVGQPVAAVAARDRYVAEDALELIDVVYHELPAVTNIDDALRVGGPRVYDDWADNIGGQLTLPKGDAAKAFAEADVIVKTSFDYGRQMGTPLETRGVISTWDPHTKELDMWMSTQAPNLARDLLGETLRLPVDKIRVRTPDVGGGFGNKFDFYGEDVIAAVLSLKSARPVKIVESRAESFVANGQSRNMRAEVEMSATKDGRITGLRGTVYGILGAVLGTVGAGPLFAAGALMSGPYDIPNCEVTIKAVHTNRPPYGSYRGWGQPKSCFAHERLIELLAKELGLPSNEVRRRNFIKEDQFPYQSQVFTFDTGRYHECLAQAEEAVAELGWQQIVKDARSEGRSMGIGYSFHIELSALGPTRMLNAAGLNHSAFDEAVVRMDSTGGVTVLTGMSSIGQGVETSLAQVAAQTMGVSLDSVKVITGDTDACPFTGYGTGASRGASMGGTSVMQAATQLRAKVTRIASHMLEAAPDDLEISDGVISVRGIPTRSVSMRDIGDAAYRRLLGVFPDNESPTLEERYVYDPENLTFSNGCSAVLVEVERDSGKTILHKWVMAHDCGVVINPTIVEGQIHGGLAQGIGGALLEELTYDIAGRPLSVDFHEYQMPTANEVPEIVVRHVETPSIAIAGGFKGVGECGTIGAAPAIAAGIEAAMPDLDITIKQVPMTASRIQRLITDATTGKA